MSAVPVRRFDGGALPNRATPNAAALALITAHIDYHTDLVDDLAKKWRD